jgi:hypothetical protein
MEVEDQTLISLNYLNPNYSWGVFIPKCTTFLDVEVEDRKAR